MSWLMLSCSPVNRCTKGDACPETTSAMMWNIIGGQRAGHSGGPPDTGVAHCQPYPAISILHMMPA
eukprot:6093721-Ditylum_brightwellii.AAC.1